MFGNCVRSKYIIPHQFKHDELRSRAYRSYYILDFDTFCQRLVHTFLNFVKKLAKAYKIISNDFQKHPMTSNDFK